MKKVILSTLFLAGMSFVGTSAFAGAHASLLLNGNYLDVVINGRHNVSCPKSDKYNCKVDIDISDEGRILVTVSGPEAHVKIAKEGVPGTDPNQIAQQTAAQLQTTGIDVPDGTQN